ncbi:MAG: dihydrofolate synthase / folylpolyglutamate synthase [Frankiaceae bacterium]|nr:dihydrofolate synthase / folylpolyglutamate synthase [Frankiaceae bacterium]
MSTPQPPQGRRPHDQQPEGFGEHNEEIYGPEPHIAPSTTEDERLLGYPTDRASGRFETEPETKDLLYPYEDEGGVTTTPEPAEAATVVETDEDVVATRRPDDVPEMDVADDVDREGEIDYSPVPEETPAAALLRVEAALNARWPQRIEPDLTRIVDLMDVLGSPQRAYPSIHITGTNGKTSTTRMIDALLRACNLRTGRTTSPHLESVVERVALDGESLSPEAFARAYDDIAPYLPIVDARHEERLTYHEILTGMAFAAFADAPIDVGVIEVGMGGSWDATNVLEAPVTVITPISLDHTEWLGSTLAAIATEKAGIVHAGSTLIAMRQEPVAAEVLVRRVAEVGARIAREGVEFGVISRDVALGGQVVSLQGLTGVYDEIFLPLYGAHQAANAAAALAAVEAFFGGERALDIDMVRAGFREVDSPGRLEVVRRDPTVLLDAAHNPAGAGALALAVQESFTFERLIGVVAVLADKDVRGVLTALEPVLDSVVVTASSSSRALSVEVLSALARNVFGADRVTVVPRLGDALDRAIGEARGGDGKGVLVTGSVVTVGEARHLLAPAG